MIGMIPGVQEMALLMKFMGDASGAMNAMNSIEGRLKSLGTGITKAGLAFTGLATGVGGVIMKLGSAGSAMIAARGEFKKMADSMSIDGEKLVETLDRIAGGTIKESDLIQKANLAMLLGGQQLAEALPLLLGIAAEKARALRMPITQAFEDIVRGVGRASPMILDNLGIIVDTQEQYKKLAVELGKTKEETDKTTESYEDHSERLRKLEEDLEIVRMEEKELNEERKKGAAELAEVNTELTQRTTTLGILGEQLESVKEETEALREEIETRYGPAEEEVTRRIEAHGEGLWALQDRLREAQLTQRDRKEALDAAREAERELVGEIKKHENALDSLNVSLEKNIEKQEELRKDIATKQVVEFERLSEKIDDQKSHLEDLVFQLKLAEAALSELTGEEKESVRLAKERKVQKLQEQIAEEKVEIEELSTAHGKLGKELAKEGDLVAQITALREEGVAAEEKELLALTQREQLEIEEQLTQEAIAVESLERAREKLGYAETEEAHEAGQRLILQVQDAIYEERDALKHLSEEKRQLAEARREELLLVAEGDERIKRYEKRIHEEEAAIRKLESAQARLTKEEKESVIARKELSVQRLKEQIDEERKAIGELIPKLGEYEEAIKGDTKALTKEEKMLALIRGIQEKYGNTVDISSEKILNVAEQTQAFTTQLGELYDRISVALVPALQQLIKWITPFIDKLTSVSPETLAIFGKIALAIVAIGGVLGPVLIVLGSFVSLLAGLPALLGVLVGPFGVIIALLGALVAGWIANIGGISGLYDFIQQKAIPALLDLKDKLVTQVIPAIIDFAKKVQEFIEQRIIPVLQRFTSAVSTLVSDVSAVFKSGGILAALGVLIDRFISMVEGFLPILRAKLLEWGRALVDWIGPRIPVVLHVLSGLISRITDWIRREALPRIVGALRDLGRALTDWVSPRIPILLQRLGDLIQRVISWIRDAVPRIVGTLVDWADAFIKWIGPMIPPLLQKLGELLSKVISWIRDAVPRIVGTLVDWANAFVGWLEWNKVIPRIKEKLENIVKSIVDFIKETVPVLLEKIGAWAHVLIDWVAEENVLGKLIEKLGEFLSGIIHWILAEGVPKLFKAALSLVQAILGAFEGGPEGEPSLAAKIIDYLLHGLLPSIIKGVKSIGAAIGRGLFEGLLQILGLSSKEAKEFVDEVVAWFDGLVEKIKDVIDIIRGVFGEHSILGILKDFLSALSPIMDKIMKPFVLLTDIIKTVLGVVSDVIYAVAGLFGIKMPERAGPGGEMKVFVVNWMELTDPLFRLVKDLTRQLGGVIGRPTTPGLVPAAAGVTIINNWPEGIGEVDKKELAEMMEYVVYKSLRKVF